MRGNKNIRVPDPLSFGIETLVQGKANAPNLGITTQPMELLLVLHKGFYPEGQWVGDTDIFIPSHPSFRRGRWSVRPDTLASMHKGIQPDAAK
jgi:hypothetical protein